MVIIRSQSIRTTRARPSSHVHMTLLHTGECHLDYVMLQHHFKKCMMAIFSNLTEKVMLVFMDDFSISGKTFEGCLANLNKVLKRCQMADLILNWEKCHFMVREGIVLGHKISEKGVKVDKVKIEVIEQLPPPTNVKGFHSFLGHAGFYRRFI
jgi:hypothetical protein